MKNPSGLPADIEKKLYLCSGIFFAKMSCLQNKSNDLITAAKLLHKNELYPAVAHSAYYCCIQLMKHIWLHSLHKTDDDLKAELKKYNGEAKLEKKREKGIHEFLIKITERYIRVNSKHRKDLCLFSGNIWQLRELRNDADYLDNNFDVIKSGDALKLSSIIAPILQKY